MEQRAGTDVLETTCAALDALRSLVDVDLACLPDEDFDLLLQTHEELTRVGSYLQQKYAGHADDEQLAAKCGYVRTVQYLRETLRISTAEAKARLVGTSGGIRGGR